MSIHNIYDLTILGNIVIDNIYCINNLPQEGTSNILLSNRKSIGGIGNIISALKHSDLQIYVEGKVGKENNIIHQFLKENNVKYRLHISNKSTSQSLIISSLSSKERTSFVNWGCGSEPYISKMKSKWTHISYLDLVQSLDLKFIRQNSKIISADLCLSNPDKNTITNICNQLKYLDYLFISESEYKAYIGKKDALKWVKLYKLKHLIYHTKNKTYIINDTIQLVKGKHNIINNIDVLGAGDAYCANFIRYQLQHQINNIKAVQYAHKQATKFLALRRIQ